MADPQRPWSNDEKNAMLAELIKQQSPHPNVLYNVLMNLNPQPSLDDIPLPAGRSINSARFAFQELRRTLPHTLGPGPLGPQTPLSAQPPGLKRPLTLEPFPAGREIRPKPAYPAAGSAGQAPASEPPQKRKRGRPTKAAAQAKAAAEAANRPEPLIGPAPVPQFGGQGAAVPSGSAVAGPMVEEARPALPPTGRMPISAVLTPTAPKRVSSSSSSSGKRRRGRSLRSEPEGLSEVAGGTGYEYESPYGRATGTSEDTPAMTAVLRHREDSSVGQQASQSDPMELTDPPYGPT